MATVKKILSPYAKEEMRALRCGDSVLLSGEIYTARDAAHARITETIENGESLPFCLENAIVYYVGPTPAKPGKIIGAAGPTTSSRMDIFTPLLIEAGLTGVIGKGARNLDVITAMQEHGVVYFGAIGGAGALISRCIKKSEVIAYEDLGTEAIRKLTVEDMPLTVIIDSEGNDLYVKGREEYICKRKN